MSWIKNYSLSIVLMQTKIEEINKKLDFLEKQDYNEDIMKSITNKT